MRRLIPFLILPLLLYSAPNRTQKFRTLIVGRVFDSEAKLPLEYATVIAYRLKDSVKVGGISTDSLGRFFLKNLPPGEYFIEVDFLGYKKKVIKPIKIGPGKSIVRLGKIYLSPTYISEKPVEVKARAPRVTFKIDRKVVQVDKQLSSESVTAVDILKNVPSIEIDIEGNVKLRGSSNFTLLIDGRPTLADPQEVLQQLPTAIIDKIEIITNPSAKYDPEGESGIINIVLKKGKKRSSGYTLSLSAGRFDNYNFNVLATKRTKKFDVYLSASGAKRNFPGEITILKKSFNDTDTVVISSFGNSRFTRTPLGVRGGMNLKLTKSDLLNIGMNYFNWRMERINDNTYVGTRTVETFKLKHPIWGAFVGFEHRFTNLHKLTCDLSYGSGEKEVNTLYLEKDLEGNPLSGREVLGSGPSKRFNLKFNYQRPLAPESNLEIGFESKIRESDNLSQYFKFDTTSGSFISDTTFDIEYTQRRNIHSIYALYRGNLRSLGFQLGLRGEFEKRSIKDLKSDSVFRLNSTDFFPSIHLTFGTVRQIMMSYTRRIRRPRGWMIAPFKVWVDPLTMRKGNPNLKSVYIDSYEIGLKYPIENGFFSVTLYHKTLHNNIERTTVPLGGGIFLETFENAGTAYRTGGELFVDLSPLNFLDMNLSFDIYRFYVQGNLGEENYENKSISWSIKMTNEISLPKNFKFNVNFRYRSPVATLQGERAGFHTLDIGLRRRFSKNLTISLRFQNIDGGFKWEYTSEGTGYYTMKRFTQESSIISISVHYSYNIFRKQREREEEPNFEEAF